MDQELIEYVQSLMCSWYWWGVASKTLAVVLGIIAACSGTLISTQKLPPKWHYGLSAVLASTIFSWQLLNPYEEYKQFRAAYADVERPLLIYKGSGDPSLKNELVAAIGAARNELKEYWRTPEVNPPHG